MERATRRMNRGRGGDEWHRWVGIGRERFVRREEFNETVDQSLKGLIITESVVNRVRGSVYCRQPCKQTPINQGAVDSYSEEKVREISTTTTPYLAPLYCLPQCLEVVVGV